MFDYADHLQSLVGGTVALILCDRFPDPSYNSTAAKIRSRFPSQLVELDNSMDLGRLHRPISESATTALARRLRRLVETHGVTHVYLQTHGSAQPQFWRHWDVPGLIVPAKIVVHAAFKATEPWGDVFAKVSEHVHGTAEVVPYMVRPLPLPKAGLRAALNISRDATVFCSYGVVRPLSI